MIQNFRKLGRKTWLLKLPAVPSWCFFEAPRLQPEKDVWLQLSDKPDQPPLILVFLLGAGLWRRRVGWGQVRTARRLNPRAAVVEARVICGGVKLQSVVAF